MRVEKLRFFYGQTKETKELSVKATFLTTHEITVATYFPTHDASAGFWQVP